MIDFKVAQNIILENALLTGKEEIHLKDALGRVLAEDIISSHDHPFFNQSAVDGYAIQFADKNSNIILCDEVAAGGHSKNTLQKGQAFRIFTGAPTPNGADTVVMQEYVDVNEENGQTFIKIKDEKLKQGGNIRLKGEQIKKGAVTLKIGNVITPTGVGFLASIGIPSVKVYKKVSVGIIVSGNEFAETGEPLAPGKIYESNGIMLQAALKEVDISSGYDIATDTQKAMENAIEDKLDKSQVLIVTGGVSVGDYDFTKPALEAHGFVTQFHKVNQKPGKPILFMKRKDGKLAFGLPGNPRSAMICYYMYVLPCLKKMMGNCNLDLLSVSLPAGHKIKHKNDGKTHFVTALVENGSVMVNRQQGSHMLLSMATSNVISVLPKNNHEFEIGQELQSFVISS